MSDAPDRIWATATNHDGSIGTYAAYESAWKEDVEYLRASPELLALIEAGKEHRAATASGLRPVTEAARADAAPPATLTQNPDGSFDGHCNYRPVKP